MHYQNNQPLYQFSWVDIFFVYISEKNGVPKISFQIILFQHIPTEKKNDKKAVELGETNM